MKCCQLWLLRVLQTMWTCSATKDSSQWRKQTVFWLAYDLAAKARNLFEGNEAQQEVATTLMNTYRNYFPAQSDCFFRGLTEQGAPYTVKCGWVSGATTVKYK